MRNEEPERERKKKYQKEYRIKNKEKSKEYQKEYRIKNKEKSKEYQKEYRIKNKEKGEAYNKKYRYDRGSKPMSKNKESSLYLGVHVAERLMLDVFKDVEWMPYGNIGFDFRCSGGYLIDGKAACKTKYGKNGYKRWTFSIKKNIIADYFLCLAFDNRESLNPLHIWLIPSKDVNDHVTISVSENTLNGWDHYRLDKMKEIIGCCNILKGDSDE